MKHIIHSTSGAPRTGCIAAALVLTLCMGTWGRPAHAAAPLSSSLQRALSATEAGGTLPVWVFFTEKSDVSPAALTRAEAQLTPHARARRERNRDAGSLVDAYDVPVDAAALQSLRSTGVHVRHVSRWLNAASVDATPGNVMRIASLPGVARLDVVHSSRTTDPEPETTPPARAPQSSATARLSLDYGSSYWQDVLIDVPAMHDLGYHGEGVWIAMFDTGFNIWHTAFSNLDVLITHDFVNGDSIVADQAGQMGSGFHGTLTLGAIAGYAPGELIGPAFAATYILAKTENTNWERHIEEDAWVAAAEWADSIGVDIISSSLSYLNGFTNGETSYTWQDMDGVTAISTIGADIAASRGILVCNAAGNGGYVSEPANTLGAPADGDWVFAVGATDAGGTRSSFSSVGYTADGRIKPDIMAMGQSVYTVNPLDSTYTTTSGTSLSCPLAAGAAALVLQARPLASNNMLMNALRSTASYHNTPDRLHGWGVIDALAARNAIATGVRETPVAVTSLVAYPNPFNPRTTIDYVVVARGRVTLTAYDVAGRRVATLVDAQEAPGHHSISWNAVDEHGATLASGVYLISLESGGTRASRKVVLLK
ncbi:MAG TPA: S8 family serine peptidase [Candidatus Krumholzibacteria bacterium]|nr:S8 family serine peptidase [Candidatus Krumholzibacteria bacterium]